MKPVEHIFVSKTTIIQKSHVATPRRERERAGEREREMIQTSFPVVSCWEVSVSLSLYPNSRVDILNDHSSIPPLAL